MQLLPPDNEVRRKHEELLLDKLYDMGILSVRVSPRYVCVAATTNMLADQVEALPGRAQRHSVSPRAAEVAGCHDSACTFPRLHAHFNRANFGHRLRMAETVQAATKLIEQGHVRCGVEEIRDPAFLVTRSMEDFVTWTVGSKIKQNIMKYRDKLDDFELL